MDAVIIGTLHLPLLSSNNIFTCIKISCIFSGESTKLKYFVTWNSNMCRGVCINEKNQRSRPSQCFFHAVFQFSIHLAILYSVISQTTFLRFLFYLLSYYVLSILKGELEGKKRREETVILCFVFVGSSFLGFLILLEPTSPDLPSCTSPREAMLPPQEMNSMPLSPSLNS